AKTANLLGSLEQKTAALAQTGHAHSEALAKSLHQKIEEHARELGENTRAETARTTSLIELVEKRIASSDENSRTEAAKAAALLENRIATLADQTKADSESVTRSLSQQIQHQVQQLAESTGSEAARTVGLLGSLEQTVTTLAEKGRVDSESLARGL